MRFQRMLNIERITLCTLSLFKHLRKQITCLRKQTLDNIYLKTQKLYFELQKAPIAKLYIFLRITILLKR